VATGAFARPGLKPGRFDHSSSTNKTGADFFRARHFKKNKS
jgi:hypothetical protein